MSEVKLLKEWTDDQERTHPVGTQLNLEDAVAKPLVEMGTAEWVGMTIDPQVEPA